MLYVSPMGIPLMTPYTLRVSYILDDSLYTSWLPVYSGESVCGLGGVQVPRAQLLEREGPRR